MIPFPHPHLWPKFKRSEHNMLRFMRGHNHRAARKWAREMKRLAGRLIEQPIEHPMEEPNAD